ncbi:MAG: hypothetical protein IJ965_01620 [Campylobacter sp.]|nr:hypothetical protein [Campylobacter sp.]
MKYWKVEGNFYSKSKYSKAQAIGLNKTLIKCKNCIDCVNCTDCTDCISCFNCENCQSCIDCVSCINCQICLDCVSCIMCRDCVDLSHYHRLKYGRGGKEAKGEANGAF